MTRGTGARRRGWTRAAAAVAAVLALAGATTPPAGAATASPTGPAAQADTTEGVTFEGISQTSWVTREGTWYLELAVDGAPDDATLSASISTRFDDRDDLFLAYFGEVEGSHLASIPTVDLATIPADARGRREVGLAVTLRSEAPSQSGWAFLSAGLRPGVYPVEIEVAAADGTELGRTIVFLTRVPSDGEPGADAPPMLVAPVFTLAGAPTASVDGADVADRVLLDRAEALADGLDASDGLPATLVPRPESVEAVSRRPVGRDVLAALRRQGRTRQVVDGTYVELPLAAWVDAGMDDELTRQRDRGNAVLTTHLGRVDSSVWSATGGFSPGSAEALWRVGVRTALVPRDAIDGDDVVDGPITIDAGGRTMEALVLDGGLSTALVRRGDPVLDAAGLAAELALLAVGAERRVGFVVAPPPEWPADADAVRLLADTLQDPVAPVEVATVGTLLDALPAVAARGVLRTPQPDLGAYPRLLADTRARLSSYQLMVGPGAPELAQLDQRLLLSGSVDFDQLTRLAHVESVADAVTEGFDAIEAPTHQTVTLTSRDGDVPLTLRNGLDDPVQVGVQLETDSRVELDGDARMLVDLAPGTNRIRVPVHARVPGDAPIDVTVTTPDGAVVLDEVEYTVRSTALPGIGVVLSIGAALVLVLWWFRHWRRTHRLRQAAEDGARVRAEIEGAPTDDDHDARDGEPVPAHDGDGSA